MRSDVIHGSPTCKYGQFLTEIKGYFNIGGDGSLITSSASNASFLNYCLDFFLDSSGKKNLEAESQNYKLSSGRKNSYDDGDGREKDRRNENSLGKYRTTAPILKAIMCFESYEEEVISRRDKAGLITISWQFSIVYGTAFILSAICIALAAMVS